MLAYLSCLSRSLWIPIPLLSKVLLLTTLWTLLIMHSISLSSSLRKTLNSIQLWEPCLRTGHQFVLLTKTGPSGPKQCRQLLTPWLFYLSKQYLNSFCAIITAMQQHHISEALSTLFLYLCMGLMRFFFQSDYLMHDCSRGQGSVHSVFITLVGKELKVIAYSQIFSHCFRPLPQLLGAHLRHNKGCSQFFCWWIETQSLWDSPHTKSQMLVLSK